MSVPEHTLTVDEIVAQLTRTGWLDPGARAEGGALVTLLGRFQNWHGLKPDGWVGPQTARTLTAPRFCAHPDRVAQRSRICKWKKRELTFAVVDALPNIGLADLVDVHVAAWAAWSSVCDLRFAYTTNDRTADITHAAGRIDGPNGTLAWSELPCSGRDDRLAQRYDAAERFVIGDARPGQIDLLIVAKHEDGHAIGLPHLPGRALMAPTYDPTTPDPITPDVKAAVKRYGRPAEPDPDPAADPADLSVEVHDQAGNRFAGTIARVPN